MRLALIGYGKMGKEIEKIACERGHTIDLIIDIKNTHDLNSEKLKNIDLAIEFTTPETAFENYTACFEAGIPVVSGTTGWLYKFEELKKVCQLNNCGFFYASNFSLGVNIFFEINKKLASIMNSFSQYNVDIEEIHHTQKLDAPSGTAISLANDLINRLESKTNWKLDSQYQKELIPISAKRIENVPGTHFVNYESEVDKIQIMHEAKSRKGFALGAVLASEFLKDKKGVFGMNDLLKL